MKQDAVERLKALHVTEDCSREVEEVVTKEQPLTIFLNDQEIVTLLCTPRELKFLAVGFLQSEGLVHNKADIRDVTIDEDKGAVRVQTSGEIDAESVSRRVISSSGGRGSTAQLTAASSQPTKVLSLMQISPDKVFAIAEDFLKRSEVFKATGGVHSAALCKTDGILLFAEDIGRHNAIDKIFGRCLLEDIPLEDRAIMTSGRVSSEILLKVARRKIPILISKAAPTDVAIKLATHMGMTLIGFVRGKRMNVYTQSWRVTDT